MKLASVVSAVITSLAPMAFAQDVDKDPGAACRSRNTTTACNWT